MQFRRFATTDIQVSAVAFGAWAAGGSDWGGADDAASVRAIHAGLDHGITTIDTAPVYGLGHSEEIVGKAIADRRDKVVLMTKCGFRWDGKPGKETFTKILPDGSQHTVRRCLAADSIREEIEASLKRLGTDYIDVYQCHAPDDSTPLEETIGALNAIRDEGKIREFGVSNFSVEQLRTCLDHGPVRSSQSMYNLILRDIEADLLPFIREHNMSLICYTPLLLGLLTGKVTMDRTFPEGDLRHGHHLFTPEYRRKMLDMLARYEPIAEKQDATLAQIAVAWLVAQDGVATVLVGARSERQAIENAAAGDIELSPEDEAFMRRCADETNAS